MFKDVAGAFVAAGVVAGPGAAFDRSAIRIASGIGVSPSSSSKRFAGKSYRGPARKHGTLHSGVGFAKPRVTPFEVDLRRAAKCSTRARRSRSSSERGARGD